jgi:hypothetical protein
MQALHRGDIVTEREVIFGWARAGASKETFSIKPIRELVQRYVGDGEDWLDPFARNSHLCELTNDINPETEADWHLDALDFVRLCVMGTPEYGSKAFRPAGIVLDPPYSYRQVSEHYRAVGRRVTSLDTSYNFYNRVMNAVCDAIRPGGHAISCGWNSNGFGPRRGFFPVELLVVRHGQHKNDTIVLVEEKMQDGEY